MSRKPRVVQSIENLSGDRCVDLLERADGRFGFEEYRRDAEDQRGWFAVGTFGNDTFETADAALAAARRAIPWLRRSAE
jgi:GH15 family glucan-1,4-alpha-glucosidase